MRLSLKLFTIAAGFCSLVSNVTYGAERGQISISDKSFRPEARAAINSSSEVLRSNCSSVKEIDRVEKRQELSASLFALQQLSAAYQNPIENEWLGAQIKALQEIIKVYERNYGGSDEKEAAVRGVIVLTMQEQWPLIQKSIRSSQLRDYLHEFHSINLERRTLEDHPEKMDERFALQTRMIAAGERFLTWLDDDKSKQDDVTQAELKALDELGILPIRAIESLRRTVNRLKEDLKEAPKTSSEFLTSGSGLGTNSTIADGLFREEVERFVVSIQPVLLFLSTDGDCKRAQIDLAEKKLSLQNGLERLNALLDLSLSRKEKDLLKVYEKAIKHFIDLLDQENVDAVKKGFFYMAKKWWEEVFPFFVTNLKSTQLASALEDLRKAQEDNNKEEIYNTLLNLIKFRDSQDLDSSTIREFDLLEQCGFLPKENIAFLRKQMVAQ